jgi:hypothetical protein
MQNTPTPLLWDSHFQNQWHLAEARNNNKYPGHFKLNFKSFPIACYGCEILSTPHLCSVPF